MGGDACHGSPVDPLTKHWLWLNVDSCTQNLFCPVFHIDSDYEISFVGLCLEYAVMLKMLMLNYVEFDLYEQLNAYPKRYA
jgi:hypothetical protein